MTVVLASFCVKMAELNAFFPFFFFFWILYFIWSVLNYLQTANSVLVAIEIANVQPDGHRDSQCSA